MQHIRAEFGFFEIWFVLSWNSSVTLPYTRNKEALPWQSILVLKLVRFYKGIRQRECKKSQYKKNIELTLAPVLRDLTSLQLSPCTWKKNSKIYCKKTLKFNKWCNGTTVIEGKHQKWFWAWMLRGLCQMHMHINDELWLPLVKYGVVII